MTSQQKKHDEHSTAGAYVHSGEEFDRDTNYIEDRIVAHSGMGPGEDDREHGIWPVEKNRYRLVAARACPWTG